MKAGKNTPQSVLRYIDYHLDRRPRKTEAQKLKLTQNQRSAFFRDKYPVIAGKGKPPVEKGYVHRLSSRLYFEVTSVRLVPGGWKLNYTVHDDREKRFYLLPSKWLEFKTDQRGDLDENLPPEEELGYTRNPCKAHADDTPSVPPDLQNVITLRSRLQTAQRTNSESERSQERSAKETLHKTLEGLNPQARVIFLAEFTRMCSEAVENDLKEAA